MQPKECFNKMRSERRAEEEVSAWEVHENSSNQFKHKFHMQSIYFLVNNPTVTVWVVVFNIHFSCQCPHFPRLSFSYTPFNVFQPQRRA